MQHLGLIEGRDVSCEAIGTNGETEHLLGRYEFIVDGRRQLGMHLPMIGLCIPYKMQESPQRQDDEMPNVASVLKSEISRVARKEVRSGTLPLRKAVSTYSTDIAASKRRARSIEQALRRLSSVHAKQAPNAAVEQTVVTCSPQYQSHPFLRSRARIGSVSSRMHRCRRRCI